MITETPEGWVHVSTECQTNPDLFFSDNPASKSIAKGICLSCPVMKACKKTAIENREKHGIWGGTDFSNYRLPKVDSPFCRSGKHKLPEIRENNRCEECRKETQKAWEARQVRDKTENYKKKLLSNRENKARHKNVEGGKCKSGHDLVGSNIIIRSGDGAIVCKSCTHRTRVKEVQSGQVRGMNMGSSNHG